MPEHPRELYLPSGARIVGAGAARIVERAAAAAVEQLDVLPGADVLYALQCTTDPLVRGRPAVEHILDAITDDIRKTWPECPQLRRDATAERRPSRFGGMRFDVLAKPGTEWLGEVLWRSVHPVVAGAPITTHVLLEERKTYTRLTVRVSADDGLQSVRGYMGAGQAQPSFLQAICRTLVLHWMGAPAGVHELRAGEIEAFVLDVLEADARTIPAAVLAPLEDGEFIVPPEDLAWELLGRARLHVIRDHKLTYRLSDAVGDRRMSCYWGAVRAYMPAWSRHDDPLEHPLLIADRLADPIMRATWLGELGLFTAPLVSMPQTPEQRRGAALLSAMEDAGPAAAGAGASAAETADRARAAAVPLDEPRAAAQRAASDVASNGEGAASYSELVPLLHVLVNEVSGLQKMVRQLGDEVERLRTISAVRASSTSAIERRLARLEDLLERSVGGAGEDAAERDAGRRMEEEDAFAGDEGAPPLVAIVQDAAESWPDALVILDSAIASAGESPYEDPERVRAILEAMTLVARRRRDGALGTSLRDAFGDLGIDYRAAIARGTSARLRQQYRFTHRGVEFEAEEHIALGNTYDPRRCLRIYFSSRLPNEPRFVIGHVGRHFEVKTTT